MLGCARAPRQGEHEVTAWRAASAQLNLILRCSTPTALARSQPRAGGRLGRQRFTARARRVRLDNWVAPPRAPGARQVASSRCSAWFVLAHLQSRFNVRPRPPRGAARGARRAKRYSSHARRRIGSVLLWRVRVSMVHKSMYRFSKQRAGRAAPGAEARDALRRDPAARSRREPARRSCSPGALARDAADGCGFGRAAKKKVAVFASRESSLIAGRLCR